MLVRTMPIHAEYTCRAYRVYQAEGTLTPPTSGTLTGGIGTVGTLTVGVGTAGIVFSCGGGVVVVPVDSEAGACGAELEAGLFDSCDPPPPLACFGAPTRGAVDLGARPPGL